MKRASDLILSFVVLVVLSPLIFVLGIMVLVKFGHPVLFKQERPGLNAKSFWLVKFRTMTEEKGCDGTLLPDSARLTAFGRFLRSTSLDELPELWNVLTGKMSLVGPRPLLVEYLDLYSDEQFRRHDVRPGITGWAQVNGRNNASWEEKFAMDVWYVDNMSIWLDIRILFKTVFNVILAKDISQDGHVTMEHFKGTRE